MKTGTYHECEICHARFFDERYAALACEAMGQPPVPPWLTERVGQEIPGFGDSGIVVAKLRALHVRRSGGKHIVACDADHLLSGNQTYGMIPAEWLDPMRGFAFLRYVDPRDVDFRSTILRWAACCKAYGMLPEPQKARWWQFNEDKQRAILDVLRNEAA